MSDERQERMLEKRFGTIGKAVWQEEELERELDAIASPNQRIAIRDERRRTRYDAAVKALLSRDPPVDPTDGNVAEYLGLEDARTIRNWRRDRSIS